MDSICGRPCSHYDCIFGTRGQNTDYCHRPGGFLSILSFKVDNEDHAAPYKNCSLRWHIGHRVADEWLSGGAK